jgi:hypothetical protein
LNIEYQTKNPAAFAAEFFVERSALALLLLLAALTWLLLSTLTGLRIVLLLATLLVALAALLATLLRFRVLTHEILLEGLG